jgi:hypothetical protein
MLVLSLGLHWALLQTIAWTGMLIIYSRDGSFQDALVKSFDGQHPCALCKMVQTGREEERTQEQQVKPGFKLDPGVIWQPVEYAFFFSQRAFPLCNFIGLSRADQPPKPRPRGLLDRLSAV